MNTGRPTALAATEYLAIVVEAHQAGLRDRCRHRVESIEPAGIGNELRPLRLEHLSDRLLGQLWMGMRLGVGGAFIEQPGVQLVKILEPQTRREEPLSKGGKIARRMTFGMWTRDSSSVAAMPASRDASWRALQGCDGRPSGCH